MIAVLGIDIKQMTEILDENAKKYSCYIANDNTVGQIAISGRTNALEKLQLDLKKKKY